MDWRWVHSRHKPWHRNRSLQQSSIRFFARYAKDLITRNTDHVYDLLKENRLVELQLCSFWVWVRNSSVKDICWFQRVPSSYLRESRRVILSRFWCSTVRPFSSLHHFPDSFQSHSYHTEIQKEQINSGTWNYSLAFNECDATRISDSKFLANEWDCWLTKKWWILELLQHRLYLRELFPVWMSATSCCHAHVHQILENSR